MEDDTKRLGHRLRRGGPQVTADFRQSELVAKVAKLYAHAAPEDQGKAYKGSVVFRGDEPPNYLSIRDAPRMTCP
jgi:hypothetical protein